MTKQGLDITRQALTLLGAILQIVTSQAAGEGVFEAAMGLRSTILPANYAFVVWAPIFLFAAVYAVWQALPANGENPLARRAGWFLAAGYFGNAIWQVLFPAREFLLAQIVITAILVVLAIAFVRLSRGGTTYEWSNAERWIIAMPLALFFGWITAAAWVGGGATAIAYGFAATGTGAVAGGAALLLGAGGVALAMIRTDAPTPRALWLTYAGTVIWALVAVAVNHFQTSPVTAGTALAIAAVVVAVIVWQSTESGAMRQAVPFTASS